MIFVAMLVVRICLLYVVGALMVQNTRKDVPFLFKWHTFVFVIAILEKLSTTCSNKFFVTAIACERCLMKSLKVTGCVRNANQRKKMKTRSKVTLNSCLYNCNN